MIGMLPNDIKYKHEVPVKLLSTTEKVAYVVLEDDTVIAVLVHGVLENEEELIKHAVSFLTNTLNVSTPKVTLSEEVNLNTTDTFFGSTYKEDKELVVVSSGVAALTFSTPANPVDDSQLFEGYHLMTNIIFTDNYTVEQAVQLLGKHILLFSGSRVDSGYTLDAVISKKSITFTVYTNDFMVARITTNYRVVSDSEVGPFVYAGLGRKSVIVVEQNKDTETKINDLYEYVLTTYGGAKEVKVIKDYSNIPFVSAISKIKNKAKITNLDREDMFILNSVYYEYQEHLRNSNSIDFDDMIPLVIELARIDDDFRRIIQCEYLLVDECQDTNQIQYELIKLMSEEHGNVFMVGDEDQLIYTFRNSDISIIKDFESNADEVIILNQNYRCNKTILELANSLIQYNPNRISKVLISDIEPVVKVEFREWASQMDEAEGVAKKIHELVKKHGIEYKDIAILYRNNNQSFVIEKELNKRKIPYDVFGGKPFFDYKDIKSVINTYRLIMDPRNEIAFANIYNQPAPSIEGVEYSKFIEHYRQNRRLRKFIL